MPAESPGVRVDSGVTEGDEVTPWYDPMLAKLVVWDSNRERARARMLQALAECRVIGVATNLGFLSRLVGCAAFAAAELDTGLVERERDFLFETGVEPPREAFVAATLAILLAEDAEATRTASRHPQPCSPWHARDGWRLNTPGGRRVLLRLGERETVVAVEHLGGGYRLDLDGASIHALAEAEDDHGLRMVLDGVRLHATVVCAGPQLHVLLHGRVWLLSRIDPLAHAGVADSREGSLLAPMPGTVGAWLVEPGAAVATGTPLMILEAMKMEHAVKAPAAGHVTRFRFAPGETVSEGDELLEFALETLD